MATVDDSRHSRLLVDFPVNTKACRRALPAASVARRLEELKDLFAKQLLAAVEVRHDRHMIVSGQAQVPQRDPPYLGHALGELGGIDVQQRDFVLRMDDEGGQH
ncbi:hypothetical protein ACFJIS_15175 [Variovorax boronicumulans]|uniref:hypothetical protein n=1 Tax=Variovorax boronicumulans TaxID=436515 RepID=UPI0036F1F8A1